MQNTQHHVVRKQYLHVDMDGTESDGLALQYLLPELCQDGLMPALERMLERLVPAHEHWTIDSLEIDAGVFSLENIERNLPGAVTEAIEKQLRERAPPAGSVGIANSIHRRTESQSVHEAFIYFLKTGSLPWWFRLPAGETLEQAVQASWDTAGQAGVVPDFFRRNLIDAISATSTQKRLALQFSPDFLMTLLASISQESATTIQEVFAKLGIPNITSGPLRRVATQLWQMAFAAAIAHRHPTVSTLITECWNNLPGTGLRDPVLFDRMTQHWPALLQSANLSDDAKAEDVTRHTIRKERALPNDDAVKAAEQEEAQKGMPRNEDAAGRIDLKEGVYINCAGLVLLHPFLPRIFEAVYIAAEGRLLKPERALCLLHFLATGQRVAPEYELLLPKLLCNLPLEAPVESLIELTADEEEEAAALLKAVIQHWDALGDTSPDSLRGTFLVRPGKLSQRENGDDLLQVETRSFDILMDRLPWGIGMIQLPWMEKILRVEWR